MSVSPIISFYDGGPDDRDRTLEEIFNWDNARLESTHDYIQWVFPLTEPSGANSSAPVLTARDVQLLRVEPRRRARMAAALGVMLRFYGFELIASESPVVRRREDFASRATRWVTHGNHNFLRLTRILRSLRIANLEVYARALFDALAVLYAERGGVIGERTFTYWQRAVTDPVVDSSPGRGIP